ncbi:MAG: hypothetical protein CL925_13945 [Deltaproteobacteria bacterium]|nr:hypothetical protein [Deltaproteobacteria bacterium]
MVANLGYPPPNLRNFNEKLGQRYASCASSFLSLFNSSLPNKRRKIFALDGSEGNSTVFSFSKFE